MTNKKWQDKKPRFKIIKGSEKDFEGAPDWALYLDMFASVNFWSEGYEIGDRFKPVHGSNERKYDGYEAGSLIIAERRPIAEPKPDANGWIEWNGGECPVKYGDLIDTRSRSGKENYEVRVAEFLYWDIKGRPGDIIAYRLSQEKQAAPAWNGEGLPPIGTECEYKMDGAWKVVKVLARANLLTTDGEIDHAIFNFLEIPAWSSSYTKAKFRPIRSPEEIERDTAIGQMERDYEEATGKVAVAFEALYDAGYRKK